jgi:predicted PurR-regulated permease PerM
LDLDEPMESPGTSGSGLVSAAATVVLAAFGVYLLVVGESILVPLVLAIFIAYLIVALAHRLQSISWRGHRLPDGLALAAAIVVFVIVIGIMIQLMAGNIRAVVAAAPSYQTRLQGLIDAVSHVAASRITHGRHITLTSLLAQVDLRSLAADLVGAFRSIAARTVQIIIYVAFLLLELRTFDRKLTALSGGGEHERTARAILQQIGQKIETYVWMKTAVSATGAGVSYVVLALIGVDFAAFWALLMFVLNFIPYLGGVIAVSFPTMLTLLQFGSVPLFLVVLITLVLIHFFMGNVAEPRLAGRSLNISPVVVVISLSIWGTIWGVTGMILSVPLMVMTMIVLAQFPRTRPLAILLSENGDIR